MTSIEASALRVQLTATQRFKDSDAATFDLEEILGMKFSATQSTIIRLRLESLWMVGNMSGYREALNDLGGDK